MWTGLSNDQVFTKWKHLDPVYGIMHKSSFFDNTPLYDYLTKIKGEREIKKRLVVSAVDANSGAFIHMLPHEMNQTNNDHIISSVVGSGSIPFFFPPRNMSKFGDDYMLIDGGTGWNNNMISGI